MPKSNWTKSTTPASVNAITTPVGQSGAGGAAWKNKFPEKVMGDAPLAYWKFDEEYGALKYADSSGNGYDLSPINGSLFPAHGGLVGDPGRGMFCPGGNGSPACDMPPGLKSSWPASQNFSVLFIIKIEGIPAGSGYNKVISIGSAAATDNNLIEISVTNGGEGRISATICDGTGGIVAQAYKKIWMPYSYLFVVVTHNASEFCVYLNGSLIASVTTSYVVPVMNRPYGGILQSPREVCPISCIIDEVALFNSCLSASRIADLYQFAAGRQS